MSKLSEKLSAQAEQLEQVAKEAAAPENSTKITKLANVTNKYEAAWSGSWIGYQSRVYYANFDAPPPGAHFSSEWGLEQTFDGTTGHWIEYTSENVRNSMFSEANVSSLDPFKTLSQRAHDLFQNAREEFISIAIISLEKKPDAFITRLKGQVENLKLMTCSDIINVRRPKQIGSRDAIAVGQGIHTPPHFHLLAELAALKNPIEKCEELAKIIRRAASHLDTNDSHRREKHCLGADVFIGHGRSHIWKDLKDFIQDRLELKWDEFNRVPVAGITNIARLSEMLDNAAIAFVVLTAEDEQSDGKMRARMNVIHEAGLFQGRLGFTKAIILLEEGCEEFSNIEGLGQIRFPKGNIKAVFEEIRRVLEREKLISD